MAKTKKCKEQDCPLFYAASEHDADLLYLSGFFAPDPFLAFIANGKTVGVFNALEITRARKESRFDVIIPLEEVQQAAAQARGGTRAGVHHCIQHLAAEWDIGSFLVPAAFPAGLALKLQEQGIRIRACEGAFFSEREKKTDAEARAIREGNAASAAGIRAAAAVLREARIDFKGYLVWKEKRLTSDRLRAVIDAACLARGATSQRTIVAGGDEACDPHSIGSRPLRAHELIIIDVFPRVNRSGYHGDMTRTFLKGRASDAQRKLVATVREAQKRALATIRTGVALATPHREAAGYFRSQGYETECKDGVWQGFFHGLGHGLGLEVHEEPRVSIRASGKLKKDAVVTVEPGLYYPGLGGCRIEDVVRVTHDGPEMLSRCSYRWHLR